MAADDRFDVVPVAALAGKISSPYSLEEIAGADVPILAAAIDSTRSIDDVDRFAQQLRSVRAVTVATCDHIVGPALADLVDAFDIVLAAPENAGDGLVPCTDLDAALDALGAAVAAAPQASVALAELLRTRAYSSVPQGLLAESLTYSLLQTGHEFAAWLAERGPATVPPDPEAPVLVERAASALTITLNRPHRANAVTTEVRDLLVEALQLAAADASIEGVILRGAGPAFCAGGDLAEFGTAPSPAVAHAVRMQRSPALFIHRLSRNVRAHLHGACIGAGIELPAFAGTVLAAPDTRIRLPEVAMGLVPGAGGTVSITRRIGPKRTAYLAITGTELDAAEALAWGLVDRIHPGESPDTSAT